MISSKTIEQIVSDKIAGSHMFLVEVTVSSQNAITVFVDSETAVTLSDCIEINKHIESQLDREVEDYELSVSSAGLSEPLKVPRQFQKNIGKDIEVICKDGSKKIGTLLLHSDSGIEIETIQKIKPEGAKRKQEIAVKEALAFDTMKSVRLHIKI